MTPTNLTDEQLITEYYKWCEQGRVPRIYSTYIGSWLYSKIQQVRDAAKKEERERCANVAENIEDALISPSSIQIMGRIGIATAIRQMEVR